MKKAFRSLSLLIILLVSNYSAYCWGFYAHQKINYYAVFLLPPEMMVLFKPNSSFLKEDMPYLMKVPGIILILIIMVNTRILIYPGNGPMPLKNLEKIL